MRVLCRKCHQPLFEIGVVGLHLNDAAILVKICEEYHDEFSFYLEGEVCNYWGRLITRRGDYNLYLNAYTRGEVHESLSDH